MSPSGGFVSLEGRNFGTSDIEVFLDFDDDGVRNVEAGEHCDAIDGRWNRRTGQLSACFPKHPPCGLRDATAREACGSGGGAAGCTNGTILSSSRSLGSAPCSTSTTPTPRCRQSRQT